MRQVTGLALFLKSAALALASCSDPDDPEVVIGDEGRLTLQWTLAGTSEPGDCTEAGASVFRASLIRGGEVRQVIQAPCDDFTATAELIADDYEIRAALLDALGEPVTGEVEEEIILIVNDTRILRLNFPETALLLTE